MLESRQLLSAAALWHFDETSGTTAADSSGNGNAATLTSGATFASGHTNNALSLNGSSEADVANNSSLNPSSQITVAAWIDATTWNSTARIVEKSTTTTDNQYRLQIQSGQLYFNIAGLSALSATLPTTGNWHYVAGTFDGSTMRIYEDGTLAASKAVSGSMPSGTGSLVIGNKPGSTNSADHFSGLIDDLEIDNTALTATQLNTQANLTAPSSPWSDTDIDSPAIAGTSQYDSATGNLLVSGQGSDIWGTVDQFHFLNQSLTGSGAVVAEVLSQANTSAAANSGVMIRADTTTSSAYAAVFITPGNGVRFKWRSTSGGTTSQTQVSGITTPVWLKISRLGDNYSGYYSTDGSTWNQVGTNEPVHGGTISLAGLAVCSQSNTLLGNAVFANASVQVATSPTVSSPWSDGDVGSVSYAGDATYDGTTFTVAGSGSDIGGTSDQLNFVSQSFSGDSSIIAQVTSQTNPAAWSYAKAGVMFRNDSTAGSVLANVNVTATNGVMFQWRSTAGGSAGSAQVTGIAAPAWVELTRVGNAFSAYYSTDGYTWHQVGSTQALTMGSSALVGLAVTGRVSSALSTATFANVSVATISPSSPGPLPAGWTDSDIGSPTTSGWAGSSSGVFSVAAGGQNIGGSSDQGHFASESMTGDGQIVTQVLSQQNTSSYCLAGVMIRDSLVATGNFAGLFISPGTGVEFVWRNTAIASQAKVVLDQTYRGDVYLKLTRQGNTLTGYVSVDNTTWAQVGQATVPLASTVSVGLAVSSNNTALLNTTTFSTPSIGAASVPTCVPQAPSFVTAQAFSGNDARVTWLGHGPSDGYVVLQSVAGGAYSAVATFSSSIADTYWPDTLTPNTTYAYKIEAYNSNGDSITTSPVTFTTPTQTTWGFYNVKSAPWKIGGATWTETQSFTVNPAPVYAASWQEAYWKSVSGHNSVSNTGQTYYFDESTSQSAAFHFFSSTMTFGSYTSILSLGFDDAWAVYTSSTLNQMNSTNGYDDSFTSTDYDYEDTHCPCEDPPEADPTAVGADGGNPGGLISSSTGVIYGSGVVTNEFSNLESGGQGIDWAQELRWTSNASYMAQGGVNGNGFVNTSMPYLQQLNDGSVVMTDAGDNRLFFLYNSTTGTYSDVLFNQQTFAQNSGTGDFTLVDTTGRQIQFYGFETSIPAAERGQLMSVTEPGGGVLNAQYNSSGQLTLITGTATDGTVEEYAYTYFTSGANTGKVQNVALERAASSSSTFAIVQQVTYSYYDGTHTGDMTYGNLGDLRSATLQDAGGNPISTSYFRYYTPNDLTDGLGNTIGYVGGMQYAFTGPNFARLAATYSDPYAATASQIANYANDYYQYDSLNRVTLLNMQGGGCSCSGNNGEGTYTYSYTKSSGGILGFNAWTTKTVETQPDGNQNIIYNNFAGETMLYVQSDITDSGNPSLAGKSWESLYKYDNQGRTIMTAQPSAITGFDDSRADLMDEVVSGTLVSYGYVSASSGLISTTDYYTSTTATTTSAGGVAGYTEDDKIQQGLTGTPILQDSLVYIAHADASGNTIYPVASSTQYRNTNGTGGQITSFAYTWFSGTNQPQSITTTLPVISSGQNGPGVADQITDVLDVYGNDIWNQDANGNLTFTSFDLGTGAVIKMVQDVNTSALTSDESATIPAGWTTPTGGGLNLVTTCEVDGLGRCIEETDSNGNVTFTVYDDPDHEVRVYPGWNATAGTTTGPTEIYREDWANGYTETLTTSDAPAVSGTAGSYVPTGAEAITVGNIQSLSRSLLDNGNQIVETDDYATLAGVSAYSTASFYLGTSGTNYYPTTFWFDEMGRLARTQEPTGNIDRTVYDSLGRVASQWVGTDDTATSGWWSPTNTAGTNLVKLIDYTYDNNGVGDSNLTQVTQHPGAGMPDRILQTAYDWRDRAVANESGIATGDTTTPRSISFTTYDNLDEPTEQDTYDGTGVLVSSLGFTSGVPNAPTSQLLAKDSASYDDQGRVYQSSVYSVDPTTGAVGSAITTNSFYDHNGNVLATFTPGQPTMKYLYDGANRVIATYTTDGGAVNNSGSPLLDWTDAGSVANDVVVSETDTTYDGDGNTILTVSKDRLATTDTTTAGALTSSNAFISYIGDYYDAADRMIAEENVGSNGGSAWTRPSTPDSRDDTHLITSFTYDVAGNQDTVTDPRGIVSKSVFDMLGLTTQTIAAYTGGSPASSTDQTTDYTYDGNDDVLTMTAVMPSGTNSQTTAYVYGVGTTAGTDLFSNDLIAKVEYPDPSTGAASTSAANDVSYSYDHLGETQTKTDQNGSTHTYSFDSLGRTTLDAVTTLGSRVDNSVLALGYTYTALSMPYQQTSYSNAAGTMVVNQVQDAYNGLQQLVTEYQEQSGAVNTSTSLKVQYGYTTLSSTTGSLLNEMIYPNGRILHYGYDNSTLDTAIGRVDYLADDNGSGSASTPHLVDYTYQGLSTILGQTNGNGVVLTDTLDTFGNIADLNYVKSGTSTDHFQYGYDRAGNVLYKNNLLNSSFSELYHANSASSGDDNTGYDPLGRLTSFRRGTLSASTNNGGVLDTVTTLNSTSGLAGNSQSWSLDAIGNQTAVTTDGTTTNNAQNSQNELTGLGSNTLTFDNNGNTTTDENANTLTYDAWNRLKTDSAGSTSYVYDADGRRVSETQSGNATTFYLSTQDQVLEERQSTTVTAQNVYGIDYVNAIVVRDDDSTSGNLGVSGSGLGSRLYYQHDLVFSVTATTNTSGAVQQRFVYTSYGLQTPLSSAWTVSGASLVIGFQGGRFDAATGLHHFGNRDYSPSGAIWLEQDPDVYINGLDRYQMEMGSPVDLVDPSGLSGTPVEDNAIWAQAGNRVATNHPELGVNPNDAAAVQTASEVFASSFAAAVWHEYSGKLNWYMRRGYCLMENGKPAQRTLSWDVTFDTGKPILVETATNIMDPDQIDSLVAAASRLVQTIAWLPTSGKDPMKGIAKKFGPDQLKGAAMNAAESRFLWVRFNVVEVEHFGRNCTPKSDKSYWFKLPLTKYSGFANAATHEDIMDEIVKIREAITKGGPSYGRF